MPVSKPDPAPAAGSAEASKNGSLTYTVKAGDNLSDIAAWFKKHGFRDIYEKNKKIIGADPDLIYPGQRIVINGGVMTMAGPK